MGRLWGEFWIDNAGRVWAAAALAAFMGCQAGKGNRLLLCAPWASRPFEPVLHLRSMGRALLMGRPPWEWAGNTKFEL